MGRSTAVSASMVRTRNKILPEEEMCCPVEWRNMSVAAWCCFSLEMVKGRQEMELSSVQKWKMEVLEQIEGFWLLMLEEFDLYWSEKGNG